MTIVSALPLIPLVLVLIWPLIPAKQKPRWVDFLPAAALFLVALHMLIDGFQPVLFGLYVFSLVLFLLNLRRMIRPAPEKPRGWVWSALGALLALGLLAFTLVPALLIPFHFEAAAPTGPHGVGTVTYGWEDADRLEAFTEDPADHRKIAVQFWYPSGAAQAGGAVVENSPLSDAQGKYPLVLFSHGAFGIRSSNTSTYLELASQGYIVASIDHAYHAFYTSFPDGTSAVISQAFLADMQRNQSGAMEEAEALRVSFDWMDLRTADIRFALDQIQALNAGSGPQGSTVLTGAVDETRIGLFGHSLGGAASAAVCRSDERCAAVAVIDSTMFGEYQREAGDRSLVQAAFPRPLMIFYNGDTYYATADHEGYVPDINAFDHAAAPAYSVVVNGAQHLNFTDLPARAPVLARMLGSMMSVNGGTAGSIQQSRCTEILNRYVLEFFNQNLRGAPSALLAGSMPFEEVDFSTHLP